MLHKARTRLTEAVVIGPGRAVVFYGRHSMGEGLRVEEARDATFLLTGAGMWVGKLAYLTANTMTIHKGRRLLLKPYQIVEQRWGAQMSPCVSASPPSLLCQPPKKFPPKDMLRDDSSNYPPSLHRPSEAMNTIDDGETRDLSHLGFLCLLWTVTFRVIGVCYEWCLQCCPDLTIQMNQDIPDAVDDTEKRHAWR